MTVSLLIYQYFAGKQSFWFYRSILCVLFDDNATAYRVFRCECECECSDTSLHNSSTAITFFKKKLLLLLLCWQCGSNQQSTCTMARQKIRISPCISCLDFSTEVEHLEFLICGKKKNHISFQQTCSVQKSSTVALPVVLRSSKKFYYL